MVRDEVKRLLELGPPPSEEELIRSPSSFLEQYEHLLRSIQKPVTDEEARLLAGMFGVDGCFGLGWTLLHLIETAPNWPEAGDLGNSSNEWVQLLKERAARWREAGYPTRSFYRDAGLLDPRTNRDRKSSAE